MTNNEADYIIDMINAGGQFSTRFQEESWGFYREGDAFRYWSERLNDDGSETKIDELWNREQLAARLTSGYSFAIFKERTRFETLVIDGRQYPIGITHFAFPEAAPNISDMNELYKLPFFPNLNSASNANYRF